MASSNSITGKFFLNHNYKHGHICPYINSDENFEEKTSITQMKTDRSSEKMMSRAQKPLVRGKNNPKFDLQF